MTSRSSLAGVEVSIIGSDSVKWIDLSVANNDSAASALPPQPLALPPEDCASCFVFGDPPLYVTWRIHANSPRAIELLEVSPDKEFPRIGLRISFPDALCPFAYICKNEIGPLANPYLLYILTISGVAYVFKLRNVTKYTSLSTFPLDEVIEFNLQSYFNNVTITRMAATAGCLAVGRNDGSVACFRLGLLDQSAPGFMYELRDDLGISRLWGFMSRGRMVGAAQDLVMQEVHGQKLLFGLHSDGNLRVWDLSCCGKILNHAINIPNSEGVTFERLWVGEATKDSSLIPLAILCRHTLEISLEMIYVFRLQYSGNKRNFSAESSMQNIPLEEGECIDVKLTSDRIWILKDNGLVFHNLFSAKNIMEESCCYALQEEFVAEHLFQSSELSSDDFLWIIYSAFPHTKDHVVPFFSSIFLRRLLLPGVHHNMVLSSTFLDYHRHCTDAEMQSLTVDGLKKEIRSLIEQEGVSDNPRSVFRSWKHFCTQYFHNWCKVNAPCGFLCNASTGVIGLVRKNSVSLFRDMDKIEVLTEGSSDELLDSIGMALDVSDENFECEVLMEVLRCITSISQQLGKTASAIFYESLVGPQIISSEEIVPRLLKILETGYSSLVSSLHMSDLGGDFALEKAQVDHKNLRKFSIDMLFSLHALSKKADSWGKVLNVIETYLQYLVPQKVVQKLDAGMSLNVNVSILVQAASQIAKSMFDSALDVLLFVNYLLSVSGRINMLPDDISRIQLELVPMIQDIVFEWFIIHFLCTTPSESPAIEDFSFQLSSLQLDDSADKRSWNEKLGKCDFTLAFILSITINTTNGEQNHLSSLNLPNSHEILGLVRDFTSWIIWGKSGEESNSFLKRSTDLALILLRHGQYNAVEQLLTIVEANSRREKTFRSLQDSDGDWCVLQHLLGCCFLAQARYGFHGMSKERKVSEAICCFFRASSAQGAIHALQGLSHDTGLPNLDGCVSLVSWKLHYYQWAMQTFEQYGISEGAYQFALAALEQVDEALAQKDEFLGRDMLNESAITIKGRLWANVFKFTLDLNNINDAYCAILSNPDEESKYICLRRFIIVLYERGGIKILCGGQIPFIGLAEKIEQELVWKADRSDVLTKPNPYKLLYAFEMHRHNWRKAASYMYQYSTRLRTEVVLKDHRHLSLVLQERLNGLSASINALHLVHPSYAWIDPVLEGKSFYNGCYPNKKAKKTITEQLSSDVQPQRLQFHIDVEKIENEFILTSAEYLLSLANVKRLSNGIDSAPSDLVDLLVQTNLYDMAFTVVLKFWKGSGLKRELEKVFSAMSLKCCPSKIGSSAAGNEIKTSCLLLTSSTEDIIVQGSPGRGPSSQEYGGTSHWETLELFLEKYKAFHAGLPIIVAETLLRADPHLELPLWLVHMFKDFRKERNWGMTGQESNPASLFRLYVDYGRFTEATNLLVECMEAFASVRPSDLIHRKRPLAAWFPYSIIERLWCQLDELIKSGHMVDQCDKLKKLLHGALLNHLKLLKVDSDDALSSAAS